MTEKETFRARHEAARDLTAATPRRPIHGRAIQAYLGGALYPASHPPETPQANQADQPQPVDEPAPPSAWKRRLRRRRT